MVISGYIESVRSTWATRGPASVFSSSRKDLYLKQIKYSTKIISGYTDLLVGIAKWFLKVTNRCSEQDA